jgi:hypothetical protein
VGIYSPFSVCSAKHTQLESLTNRWYGRDYATCWWCAATLGCCCIRGSCALAAWPASMCASRRSASLTLRGLVLARVLSLVLSFPLSRRPKCVLSLSTLSLSKCVLSLSMPCERLLSVHVHVLQPPPLVVAARRSGGAAWGCAGGNGGNQGDHMLTVQALEDMRRVLQGIRTVPLLSAGLVLGPRCVLVFPLLFSALQKGASLEALIGVACPPVHCRPGLLASHH